MSAPTSQPSESFAHLFAQQGLLGPAHRWKTAEELPPYRYSPLVRSQDPDVQAAHHFQQLVKRGMAGTTYAAALYPEVAAAVVLDQEKAKVDCLKIGVFGDLSWEEIARHAGVDVAVAKTWSSLFYDAAGSRNAFGWVAVHIVQPEIEAGNIELAAKLRLVAAVGPAGARAVLDLDSGAPVTAGEQLFRRKLQLHLKFDQAMAMSEGPEYHFRFVKLYASLRIQEKRLKIAEQKLAERCNAALRRHELAKIRAETALEREKRRGTARRLHEAEPLILQQQGRQHELELAAERARAFDRAEEEAAAARAAASPLARLRWPSRPVPADGSPAASVHTACAGVEPTGMGFRTIPFPQEDDVTIDPVMRAVSA